MKIVIAHLYYDLLNLYGESGNVKALKRYLENQGIEVEIKNVTMFDKFEFLNYDFVYIGMGTENNQSTALEYLMNFRKDIKDYINNDGFLLATGNSLEMFGKYIIDKNKEHIRALSIFPYYSEISDRRMVCESIVNFNELDKEIIGFQNRCSIIKENKNYWFETIKNFKPQDNTELTEGIRIKNFYGTYLVGPLLARNPHLLENIAHKLILSKNKDFEIKSIDFELEYKAYEIDKKRYEDKI